MLNVLNYNICSTDWSFPFRKNNLRNVHVLIYNECIIIWNRHGHECSRIWTLSGNFTLIQCIKKCQDFLGTAFFLGSNLVSFNRAIVPYEISKINFRIETKILVSIRVADKKKFLSDIGSCKCESFARPINFLPDLLFFLEIFQYFTFNIVWLKGQS